MGRFDKTIYRTFVIPSTIWFSHRSFGRLWAGLTIPLVNFVKIVFTQKVRVHDPELGDEPDDRYINALVLLSLQTDMIA